jgi:hypothetical protein
VRSPCTVVFARTESCSLFLPPPVRDNSGIRNFAHQMHLPVNQADR